MITNIHIQGFRRLYDFAVPIRPLTVVIGANGVGKSTLLDTFELLSLSASKNLTTLLTGMEDSLALLHTELRHLLQYK
ncbi:MAG: AAA family ATPase [Desulfovibrio sp.]|nr:AAA family ATPase [Desulfovibrio sp.]